MKAVIALLFLICVWVVPIYLHTTKHIDGKVLALLLICGSFVSFGIANHDMIRKLKYKELEIETFERQVEQIKTDAKDEIEAEVAKQRKSLSHLAETVIKMTYVLEEGASIFGGVPKEHRDQIKKYKSEIAELLSSDLDAQIKADLDEIAAKCRKRIEEQKERDTRR